MKTLEASQLRSGISEALNNVAFGGQRIAIKRYGKPVAFLVSAEDIEMLDAMEDRFDVEMAKKSLREKGSVPWSRVKKKLGLK